MRIPTAVISFILLVTLLSSCQSNKSNPILEEAYDIHKESMAIRQELQTFLDGLSKITDSTTVNMLAEMRESLESWDQSFVEVPGYEHEHHHDDDDHDHHHHHNTAPNLTPKEHLTLQKHLFEEIKKLEDKIKK